MEEGLAVVSEPLNILVCPCPRLPKGPYRKHNVELRPANYVTHAA